MCIHVLFLNAFFSFIFLLTDTIFLFLNVVVICSFFYIFFFVFFVTFADAMEKDLNKKKIKCIMHSFSDAKDSKSTSMCESKMQSIFFEIVCELKKRRKGIKYAYCCCCCYNCLFVFVCECVHYVVLLLFFFYIYLQVC